MWTDVLPSKEYTINYIKAMRIKHPYDHINYTVAQRPIGNKMYWGIYNPLIGQFEFVWIPHA
jgi:hypothetical protein